MLLIGIISSFVLASCKGQLALVTTTLGNIRGSVTGGVYTYLGIPYAESPTKKHRFEPPREKLPFQEDFYSATDFKSACFQDESDLEEYLSTATTTNDAAEIATSIKSSEDCLYLNIYSSAKPNATNLKPVMVFIHGGGFSLGTGAAFKGTNLALVYEVLVVTINYRLGAFGFLSDGSPEFSGNYGILDQKMALKWIKTHIEPFGGDPNLITVFGEEAGASSVHIHLLSNEKETSFRNAIVQSAHYDDGVWTAEHCKHNFQDFQDHLKDLGYLENKTLIQSKFNLSAEEILEAANSLTWRPCMHSNILEDSPQKLIQNNAFAKDINILIGTNAEVVSETSFEGVMSETWFYNATATIVTESFPQLYGNLTENDITRMKQNYGQFYSVPEESLVMNINDRLSIFYHIFSDQLYKTWVQEISWETSQRCQCSVFTYEFRDQRGSSKLSAELPHIFGYATNYPSLTSMMGTIWTNFAKTGHPNNENDTLQFIWPEYKTYGDKCRKSFPLEQPIRQAEDNEVTSRSWSFWNGYHSFLELSCFNNHTNHVTPQEPNSPADQCQPSVKDSIGMDVSNEEAGIMLVVFISFSCFFFVTTIVATVLCCKYKKKMKKMKKKNKKAHEEHENPTMNEYKL